ncbi:transposase [Trichothermofontia sichuanensis B231]|uniref:transposase n=1 Tax=Trichothermofontia sichuanensis TaxID=3045816 RepID=UPI002247D07E|nr:transposase [Trichothermofontia sichuanensis]UZQ53879.1 transposase [Trichothermofontia sichuanensis B231]
MGDIEGGELLEVIDSHKQDEIIEVLKQQPVAVREQVQEVSVDMWGGFPKVVQAVFTNARLVFDRFHVTYGSSEFMVGARSAPTINSAFAIVYL